MINFWEAYKSQCGLPSFSLDERNIDVLSSPEDFHEELKKLIKHASIRLMFSSLYIGISPLEKNLVKMIRERMSKNDSLNVSFLLDFGRAKRGMKYSNSSMDTLKPLLGTDKSSLYLFDANSKFHSVFNRAPSKLNELLGVHHIKLYISDETVLLSGANLNKDYFKNRTDRYISIKNKFFSNFCCDLVQIMQKYSYRVSFNQTESKFVFFDPKNQKHDCLKKDLVNLNSFQKHKRNLIGKGGNGDKTRKRPEIIPLLQFPKLCLSQETNFFHSFFAFLKNANDFKLFLSSGYLNLPFFYLSLLENLKTKIKEGVLVFPSKDANSFSKGNLFKRLVPSLYEASYSNIKTHLRNANFNLMEYCKKGQSFHAKGVWVEENKDILTVLGSSNFNERSVRRDFELSFALFVPRGNENKKLLCDFRKEKNEILKFCRKFDKNGTLKPSPLINMLFKIFRTFI